MPNHIKNRIELIGSDEEIKSLLEKFSTFYPETPNTSYDNKIVYKKGEDWKDPNYEVGWLDENTNVFTRRGKDAVLGVPDGFKIDMDDAWTRFPDFEKIFPIPEIIKEVGSIHSGIETAVKKKYKTPLSDNSLLASLEHLVREQHNEIKPEDQWAFEKACKAYEETGYIYWYDYQIAHWGTKWNSYSCEKVNDNVYTFETAWSGVPNLIVEMSKHFRGTILYKYSDENLGYNVGNFKIASGLVLDKDIPTGGSQEAYEIAFELRPDRRDHYILVDGKYKYKDEEEDDDESTDN